MPSFHPSPDTLPESFPVFPLIGALLLPRGRLPLNIFEPRYIAMIEDALASGRVFGMIQPDPSRRPTANGPALYHVGCLGRIVFFAETDDCRFLITLAGVIRFRVAEEIEMRRGYRRVRADFTPYWADLDEHKASLALPRDQLLQKACAYLAAHGFKMEKEAIRALPDVELVASLAMACPFTPAEKQALLQAPTLAQRAEALLALFEIDRHARLAPSAKHES
jgi:Lon protease-like protein